MIAHVTPTAVVVKRASDAGRFWGRRIIMSAQLDEAIAPAHALFDQRPAIHLPVFERGFHSARLVCRNSDPLLRDRIVRPAFAREAQQFPDFPADRHDLEVRGAGSTHHADRYDLARCRARADFDEFIHQEREWNASMEAWFRPSVRD